MKYLARVNHHQMANTEIKWIIFFAVEDGKALYSQEKQDWEVTVAQIMNSLVQNRAGMKTTGISAFPLGWPWEAQSSPRVARESWGVRSSHCRENSTSRMTFL